MKNIVVLGAGKIGRMVSHFIGTCGDYRLRVGDAAKPAVDAITRLLPGSQGFETHFDDRDSLDRILAEADAVISCAPFHCNVTIAERALAHRIHYLDLTEDVEVTRAIQELSQGATSAFIPQCGLAPGFITIVSLHLIERMSEVSDLRLRVGALPRYPDNRLKYNLTWSTEGLINEYCNPCEVVIDGELRTVAPLENLEEINIDGVQYEAFNTSGGLGTLATSLRGRVRNVSYKSLRYPGHNYLIQFLLHDLKMKANPGMMVDIFNRCLPATRKDVVVIFCSAIGVQQERLIENVYARTIFHREVDGQNRSAIQITTAASVCAVLDLLIQGDLPQQGYVRQEQVEYEKFIANRFGRHFA